MDFTPLKTHISWKVRNQISIALSVDQVNYMVYLNVINQIYNRIDVEVFEQIAQKVWDQCHSLNNREL